MGYCKYILFLFVFFYLSKHVFFLLHYVHVNKEKYSILLITLLYSHTYKYIYIHKLAHMHTQTHTHARTHAYIYIDIYCRVSVINLVIYMYGSGFDTPLSLSYGESPWRIG